MRPVRACFAFVVASFLASALAVPAVAQTPPPAPALTAPANGAALAQPITLDWNAVVDPDGPIGSYTWQVSNTSAFTAIVLSGFTNNLGPDLPTVTQDKVSGLSNGTYFWRVKASQTVGGATGSIDSPWSAVRTFSVTGLGPAPATPAISTPASDARFSPGQTIAFDWSDVNGAASYTIQIDDADTFPAPLIVGQNVTPSQFSTSTLPTKRMWWRVRANDAAGNPGAWSAVRRFEVKN